MKTNLVALLSVCVLVGCAAFSDKVEHANKTDEILAKIDCVADAVKPYEKHFSKKQLSMVLTGELDAVDVLKSLEVTPSDVADLYEALKACK